MTSHKLNETILALYRQSRTCSSDDFKERAMETVRELVPFDSGLWGTADMVSEQHPSMYLFHQPVAMLENYHRTMGIAGDLLAHATYATPGRTIRADDLIPRREFVTHPLYLQHCRLFGMEHSLSTCHIAPITNIPTGISFFRADPESPFTEVDRLTKELVTPHMIEAMRINLFANLHGNRTSEVGGGSAQAICDSCGVLYQTTPRFSEVLMSAWPDWRGPKLSFPFDNLKSATVAQWLQDGLRFDVEPCRDLFLLSVAPTNALDLLSARQLEVAQMLATGKRYKDIARTLNISPSTVTKHVNQINLRLGIEKREELIQLFDRR